MIISGSFFQYTDTKRVDISERQRNNFMISIFGETHGR